MQRRRRLHQILVSRLPTIIPFLNSTHLKNPNSLEKRGWKVSSHGMSVPVGKRSVVDREHYLDATQRYVSPSVCLSAMLM